MKKWRMGILGASDIAYKRFLPALQKSSQFLFAGIASREPARCKPFLEQYGGQCYPDYQALLCAPEIDCVYLPLPPALHAYWGERVLREGKHLLMEKPFTTTSRDTQYLLELSQKFQLAVHENYTFLFHRQLKKVQELISNGTLGELRMIRASFTFPFRGAEDFRYQKELGGGALLDCGGYPLLLASKLLGSSAKLMWSNLSQRPECEIETGGSAVLMNSTGLTAHVFFGMNDTYRCELEVWGSKASVTADRIFTAPPNLPLAFHLKEHDGVQEIQVEDDNQFLNSIQYFAQLIDFPALREGQREKIFLQSTLIEQIQRQSTRNGEDIYPWEKLM